VEKICIIGTGNVAWHMNRLCLIAGHDVIQIIGRDILKAQQLRSNENTQVADNLYNITPHANVYIICVNDDMIREVASTISDLIDQNAIVIHTSGSKEIDILTKIKVCKGSMWPIQSLTKGIPLDANLIPVAISTTSNVDEEKVLRFVNTIFATVHVIEDTDKPKWHLAAVMLNNFTNHIIALSQEYMITHQLDFRLMEPLLHYTIDKLSTIEAADAQTGPARRHDKATINKHIHLLHDNPEILQVYKLLTQSINSKYPAQ
jgi:predicted short-subunit dehydrogenase-like oxidoreductase (DUF2520 family)